MHFWRKLSIQNKLILSMTSCLLVFVAISSGLSIRLIGNAVRDRVVREELPTAVNGIRADVQRQMAGRSPRRGFSRAMRSCCNGKLRANPMPARATGSSSRRT